MKAETKVGILFLTAISFVLLFAYLLGLISPFSNSHNLNVMYNFAGGIEEGSPVRLMGIKVGKVKKIEFDPTYKSEKNEEVKLKVVIQVEKKVWSGIRKDSKFFINLAGVIGEKFLEISPGSLNSDELKNNEYVRGEDPPRIDQLISQSYGLAGRLIELVNKNEGTVSNLISQIDHLLTNFNKTLSLLDRTSKNKDTARLIDNLVKISDDLAVLTSTLRGKKSEESFSIIHKLLSRIENVDAAVIKKFFQEEGIRAKVF